MSSRHRHVGEVERDVRLRDAVLGILSTATGPVTAAEISTPLAATPEETGEVLSELADEGEVARLPGPDGTVQWRTETATVRLTHEANSYRVQDDKTGLVTRAGDRPDALRRLADRIEQYESGRTAGAQIVGISETTLSPDYAPTIAELTERYVEPDDKHIYVYVAGEGIREIELAAHLDREYDIQGFAITGQFDREEFAEAVPVSVQEIIDRTRIEPADFPLGMYKLMAVHPDHQNEGIGAALSTHGMAYLANHPPVVTMLWERENDGNIKLAEDYGFERLATFEETSPSKWRCPDCGFDTVCSCSSALYGWGFA
ncbi:MAG: hypothetical protein ABEJ94_06920 [Halorientalis sp.]